MITITEAQNALILGTLLGDGFVQKRGDKARLRIHHSWQQRAYVDWKYAQVKTLCARTQPPKAVRQSLGTGYGFATQSEACLVRYHQLFYRLEQRRYRKVIRAECLESITHPLSLAVWWMDDGSPRTDCRAGRLATQGFSLGEHQLLQHWLRARFEINTAIVCHSRAKGQYCLSIPAKNDQFDRWVALIEPYVVQVPSMMYKLGKPRND